MTIMMVTVMMTIDDHGDDRTPSTLVPSSAFFLCTQMLIHDILLGEGLIRPTAPALRGNV